MNFSYLNAGAAMYSALRIVAFTALSIAALVSDADAQGPPIATQRVTQDSIRADSTLLAKVQGLERNKEEITRWLAEDEKRRYSIPDSGARQFRAESTNANVTSRISALERQHDQDNALEAVGISYRVRIVQTILSEMNKGVTFITFIQNAIDLEQTDALVKNLWASEQFRNGWDRVSSWGSLLGGATAVGGLASSGDVKLNLIGIGASAIGIARLLGDAFGKDRADRASEVMQRIALSRRAFDALSIRNSELRIFVQSNLAFRLRVQGLDSSLASAKGRADSLAIVVNVGPLLDEYAQITAQIPTYVDAIVISNEQHAKSYPALATALTPITRKGRDLLAQYKTDVLPILQYANRLRALLDPDVVRYMDASAKKKQP